MYLFPYNWTKKESTLIKIKYVWSFTYFPIIHWDFYLLILYIFCIIFFKQKMYHFFILTLKQMYFFTKEIIIYFIYNATGICQKKSTEELKVQESTEKIKSTEMCIITCFLQLYVTLFTRFSFKKIYQIFLSKKNKWKYLQICNFFLHYFLIFNVFYSTKHKVSKTIS